VILPSAFSLSRTEEPEPMWSTLFTVVFMIAVGLQLAVLTQVE
jgi:hypothetical protein